MQLAGTDAITGSQDDNVLFDIYMKEAASDLERTVIRMLKDQGIRLPVSIHKIISKDGEPIAEADLYYDPKIVVFIDGPAHEKEYVKLDDDRKRTKLKKLGYKVIVILYNNISEGVDALIESIRRI